jgi:hypothetical protein
MYGHVINCTLGYQELSPLRGSETSLVLNEIRHLSRGQFDTEVALNLFLPSLRCIHKTMRGLVIFITVDSWS